MTKKVIEMNIWIILNEQHKVVWAWEHFGGSFTKGLASALMHADPQNTKKIHDTWPEYWKEGLKQYKQTHVENEPL